MSKELTDFYNERLNKWVNLVMELEKEIQDLKAENKRLLKMGDAMYKDAVEDATGVWLNPAFEAWRTYKGVQS